MLPVYKELQDAGLTGHIAYGLFANVIARDEKGAHEAIDEFACCVARAYESGELSFESADTIMNAAFVLVTSQEYWAAHGQVVPPDTFEVYQAFDEGEYHHSGDETGVVPEEKYTKGLIKAFLRKRGLIA